MSFPLINVSQYFDSSGAPLASGTIEFRSPSTNAYIDTFPTADDADAGTNANDNPITLNARGEAATGIYLEDGVAYKIILKDFEGATIWTQDDVLCPIALPYGVTAAETAASVTPVNLEYPPGDVRRYGDNTTPGTTDMSTIIQNALNSNNDVYLPSDTYYIGNATLIMPTNTTLRGDGEHSLITSDASTKSAVEDDNMIDVLLDNVVIKDIALHGDRNNASNRFNGIWIDDAATDTSILNVTFIDHGVAIWLEDCVRVLIDGCRFLKETKNTTGIVGQADATQLVTYVTITNCFFGETGTEAIDLQSYCQYWTISHNHFYKNCTDEDGEAIDIGGIGGTNNYITIDSNTCDAALASQSFAWIKQGTHNITLSNNVIKNTKVDAAGAAFRLGDCLDVTVIGNTVETCPRVAYILPGGSPQVRSRKITISGNAGEALGLNGVESLGTFTAGPWGLTISNNHFHTTSGTGAGISVLQGLDVTITDNTVDGFTGNGIELIDTAGDVLDFTVTGNVIRACTGDGISIKADRGAVTGNVCDGNTGDGIQLDDSNWVTVTGNTCYTNTGYGLNVSSACTYVAVTGNVFNNNTAGETNGINSLTLASAVQGNVPPIQIVYTLANDGTPYVGASAVYKTGGTTTITDFDFGVVGQTITILAEHAITIQDNAAIILNGSANFVMASGDTLTLTMFNDQIWQEVSRTVNL